MNWIHRLFHRHKWVTWKAGAIGSWEKQEGQGSMIYVPGLAQCCKRLDCDAERFVPYDRRLRPVGIVKIVG